MRSRVSMASLTSAVALGVAIFFTLYSLIPVTRGDEGNLSSLFLGTMMSCVMGVQVFTPALVRRFSLRLIIVASLVLVSVGALITGTVSGTPLLLVGAIASGMGFGVLIVAGAHGVALIVSPFRLGRALGAYGLVTMAASALGSPAGLQIALTFSSAVFGVCALIVGLLGAAFAFGIPGTVGKVTSKERTSGRKLDKATESIAGTPWLMLVVLLVAVVLLSHGLSSLPVLATPYGSAATVVFAVQFGSALGRGIGGEMEARIQARVTLIAGAILLTGGGTLGVLIAGGTAAITAGALIGLGIGIVQAISLHTAMQRMDSGRASVVWNLAVDGGLWTGGILWGLALTAGLVPATTLVFCTLLLATTAAVLPQLPGRSRRHV